ncbi:hypothetical protein B0H14DRAFT_187445 [Mycena olivaceomarginata]|nr:hypothetical protein B0H14DRAFT_187445 [Mycena olivaceomarginata]
MAVVGRRTCMHGSRRARSPLLMFLTTSPRANLADCQFSQVAISRSGATHRRRELDYRFPCAPCRNVHSLTPFHFTRPFGTRLWHADDLTPYTASTST